MEFKFVILSLACFSCLLPEALGTSLVAAKAVGAGVAAAAAKGALIKGAAVLGAKAAVKGAALLAAKGLAAKGALAAGAAAVGAHVVAGLPQKPSLQVQYPQTTVVLEPPHLSTILERVTSLIGTFANAAKEKSLAVGSLLTSFLPTKTIVSKPAGIPELIIPPPVLVPQRFYAMPPRILHPQPPVAIVGPSMNVYQHPHNDAFYPMPLVEKDC